ncbi:MAG: polyprenyl synthetase family protein [Candidatus Dadabacteria bacterium]|nr:MAG: polyprenyl synthetase family protein [Candidatus Dadabacteria bacterium]
MQQFHDDIARFEAWLLARIEAIAGHARLKEAMRAAAAGGKRFRATLAIAAARMAGQTDEQAWPIAGAIEMIHAYSLVHDDLPALDNADLRRGQPTLHRAFGEAVAVLAGDALLTDAFGVLTDLEAPADRVVDAVRTLAAAAGTSGMVSGQTADILDLASATTVEEVAAIHRGKTGALIEWSILTPLRIWAPDLVAAATPYAEELGVLFQVRDDLLDLDPNAAQDKDRDHDGEKSTYARLLGIDGAREHAQKHLERCIAAAEAFPAPHDAVFKDLAAWTAGRLH